MSGPGVALESRVCALAGHLVSAYPDREHHVAALVDEAGELLHEVRRWLDPGKAGSLEALAAELADVVLAAQVTARALRVPPPGLVLDDPFDGLLSQGLVRAARETVRAAVEIDPDDPSLMLIEMGLVKVQMAACRAAGLAGVDLAAAVEAKLLVVEARLGLVVA